MTSRTNLARGLGWIVLTILCWVPLFPVAKRVLPLVDAFAMGTIRYVIGGALFVVLLAAAEGRRALSYEGRFLPVALLGLIGITGFNCLVWWGLTFTRPEHAAIIMGIQTPLTALALWVARGVRPAQFTLICIGVAFTGVLLVVTQGDPMRAFAGGALLGENAVEPVVSIVSHGCDDRIVARSDCMFVCGTTSNVHVMSPLVGGGGFGERGST